MQEPLGRSLKSSFAFGLEFCSWGPGDWRLNLGDSETVTTSVYEARCLSGNGIKTRWQFIWRSEKYLVLFMYKTKA